MFSIKKMFLSLHLANYYYFCINNLKNREMMRMGGTIVSCIALLASCQQVDDLEERNEMLMMSVEASIGNLSRSVESRYVSSDNTPNNLSFKNGNSIGVFVGDCPAVKWTKGVDGWDSETTVYWPDKHDPYDFYAYYPYVQADSKGSVQMPSLDEQEGTIGSLSVCDFLVAVTNQSYGNDGVVSFTGETASFKHVSSLLVIMVDGKSDLSTSTIKKFSFVAPDIASGTTYSFSSQTNPVSVTKGKESNVLESADLDFTMTGVDHTFYFIANNGVELKDVIFTVKYSTGDGDNAVDYTASKTGLGNATLVGGKQYNFKLNITDGVVNITGGGIQNWGDGGKMDDIIINNPKEDGNEEA